METGDDGADEKGYGESAAVGLHSGLGGVSSAFRIVRKDTYKHNTTKQDHCVWNQGSPHAVCGSIHHGLIEMSAMFGV